MSKSLVASHECLEFGVVSRQIIDPTYENRDHLVPDSPSCQHHCFVCLKLIKLFDELTKLHCQYPETYRITVTDTSIAHTNV